MKQGRKTRTKGYKGEKGDERRERLRDKTGREEAGEIRKTGGRRNEKIEVEKKKK